MTSKYAFKYSLYDKKFIRDCFDITSIDFNDSMFLTSSDLLLKSFLFLPLGDFSTLPRVSLFWNKIVLGSNSLWREIFRQTWLRLGSDFYPISSQVKHLWRESTKIQLRLEKNWKKGYYSKKNLRSSNNMLSIDIRPDGDIVSLVSGGYDGLFVWDIDRLEMKRRMGMGEVRQIVQLGNEIVLASEGRKKINVWNVENCTVLRSIKTSSLWFDTTCLANNYETIVVGGSEKKTTAWDIETGQIVRTFTKSDKIKELYSMQCSNDVLIRASEHGLHGWDYRSGYNSFNLDLGYDYMIQTVRLDKTSGFANDWLCMTSGNTIRLYDLRKSGASFLYESSGGTHVPSACAINQRWIVGGWLRVGEIQIWDRKKLNGLEMGSPISKIYYDPITLKIDADHLYIAAYDGISILDFSVSGVKNFGKCTVM